MLEHADPVPAPVPPDDADAWYAPEVRSQYEVHPGVVVTVSEREDGFEYGVRTPPLGDSDAEAFERVTDYFADAQLSRPRTREGTRERPTARRVPRAL